MAKSYNNRNIFFSRKIDLTHLDQMLLLLIQRQTATLAIVYRSFKCNYVVNHRSATRGHKHTRRHTSSMYFLDFERFRLEVFGIQTPATERISPYTCMISCWIELILSILLSRISSLK